MHIHPETAYNLDRYKVFLNKCTISLAKPNICQSVASADARYKQNFPPLLWKPGAAAGTCYHDYDHNDPLKSIYPATFGQLGHVIMVSYENMNIGTAENDDLVGIILNDLEEAMDDPCLH